MEYIYIYMYIGIYQRHYLCHIAAAAMHQVGKESDVHYAQAAQTSRDSPVDGCQLPSGKHTKNYRKSPFWIGKSTMNGVFSIAMSNYQRVPAVTITLWMINVSVIAKEQLLNRRFGLRENRIFWMSATF